MSILLASRSAFTLVARNRPGTALIVSLGLAPALSMVVNFSLSANTNTSPAACAASEPGTRTKWCAG